MSELEQQRDILVRLESAVADWTAQVSRAQQGLSDHLSRAKDRLDAVVQDLREDTQTEQRIADLQQRNDTLEARVQTLIHENEALRSDLAQARAEFAAREAAHSQSTSRLAELDAAVNTLTARARILEEELARVNDNASQPVNVPAPESMSDSDHSLPGQLARALSDRQEAHHEIVSLRTELETLRRKAAITVAATPQPSGVPDAIAAAAHDEVGHKRRIGEILVTAGVITPEQLTASLEEQETARHRRLGEILVERGDTAEELIAQVLASQVQAPFVRLESGAVERGAHRMINERLASHHVCIPIRAGSEDLTLAMANPLDLIAIEDVELASGRRVIPVVATTTDIRSAIARYYR